jgi:hypothetical protein
MPEAALVRLHAGQLLSPDVLGVPAFAGRYVEGWAQSGFDYFAIPLERQAYELQNRFERGELRNPDVEGSVREALSTV